MNHGPDGQHAQGQTVQGAGQSQGWSQRWSEMLQNMRRAASDPFIPDWQRALFNAFLGVLGDSLGESANSNSNEYLSGVVEMLEYLSSCLDWKALLIALLVGCLLWRYRYPASMTVLLSGAGLFAARFPVQSVRFSALAVKVVLRMHGHRRLAGQSFREHWSSARDMPPLAKQWLGYAVACYCGMRFGEKTISPQQALMVRQSVLGAYDILRGVIPELARS